MFAFLYRKKGLQKFKYNWEKENYQPDEFDQMFDENGNFNPKIEENAKEPSDV